MTSAQKSTLLHLLQQMQPHEFHHGDCIGADAEAHEIARALGAKIHIHPPIMLALRARTTGFLYPPKHYHERNEDIVNSTDLLLAAPKGREQPRSGGTWWTIKYAGRQKKRIIIIYPEGDILQSEKMKNWKV